MCFQYKFFLVSSRLRGVGTRRETQGCPRAAAQASVAHVLNTQSSIPQWPRVSLLLQTSTSGIAPAIYGQEVRTRVWAYLTRFGSTHSFPIKLFGVIPEEHESMKIRTILWTGYHHNTANRPRAPCIMAHV